MGLTLIHHCTKPMLGDSFNTYMKKVTFKYITLKNIQTTEIIECVDVNCLTKKEIAYFLNLEIVNENYEVKYEESEYKQPDVYDNGWHTLRNHLNLQFPLKFKKTKRELDKEYPYKY